MKTTLKNKLSNYSFVFLLTLFTFNSCSKDETISTPEEQGQIEIEIREGIESIELKSQVEQNLSKIKQLFKIIPPKSMRKSNGKEAENDTINLENIQVNTEAYGIIKNENGKDSYTFEVDFPTDSTSVQEIINLHTYYDDDNQLKSKLIRYELTNEEFLVATKNQSFDGFWDKISYLDLDATAETSNSTKNTLARSGDTCTCEDDSPPTVVWVPYPTDSSYGGSSASGVGYALPPLNTLPPNVMAALQAAGVFVGVNYNNFAPYGYGHNYTTPVQYFSVNDLTIPSYNPSSSGTPFNNYYAYYFPGIKNIIEDYYEKVYVPQINSYVNSSLTTIEDHIVKQKVVYDFFQFTFELYAQNTTSFYYLSSNHELTESIFYYLAENNSTNYDYTQAKAFAISAIVAVMDTTNDINSLDDYIDSYFELNPEEWIVYEETPGNIIDLNEYLNCFNNAPTTATFKLSIFVDQPVPNQDDTWTNDGTLFNPDINVGHTFISLEMNSVENTINQTIGYYPSAGVSPSNPQIAGAWVDDGNHDYDVSASIDLTHTQFTNLISNLQTFGTPTYNLNTLNCTDAALLAGNSIGMNLPDTNGTWIGGGGSNPGNLGQDIRGLSSSNLTINTTSGTAALSEGPCN